MTITLAHKSISPSTIKKRFADVQSEVGWIFLGEDYLELKEWESALGDGFKRIETGRRIDEASDTVRHPFVGWVEELNRRYGDDVDWWMTPIANRNPVESPLFRYAVYLAMIKKLLESKAESPLLIIVESHGLLNALKIMIRDMGVAVNASGNLKAWFSRASGPIWLLIYWGWFLSNALLRHLYAMLSRPKGFKKNFEPTVRQYVLIDTYVYPSQFETREFKDRHFPHLHEWLRSKGFDIYVLPSLAGFSGGKLREAYQRMRRFDTNLIVPEDWLGVKDYLSVVSYSLKEVKWSSEIKRFEDFDLSPILRELGWRQVRISAKLKYLLQFRLSDAGFNPWFIIDWFENQDTDKALSLGARKAYKNTEIIGVQHFLPYPNFISLFPAKTEADFGAIPHRMVTCGIHQKETLPGFFDSGIDYEVGAGLRYDYMLDKLDRRKRPDKTVILLLPSRLSESVEMLEMAMPVALKRRDIAHWRIKPHPDYRLEELKEAFGEGRWFDGFEPFNGSFKDALREADVAMSQGSGTAIEMAAMGVPVIMLSRQAALNYNPMHWFPGFARMCYNELEIDTALDYFLSMKDEEKEEMRNWGLNILERCFQPKSEESMKVYLRSSSD